MTNASNRQGATADATLGANRELSAWPWPLWTGVSVAGALALFASFAPVGWWALAPVGFALLLLTWRHTGGWSAAASGALAGTVFFALHLEWLRVVGPDAWLLIVFGCALFYALMAAAVSTIWSFSGRGSTSAPGTAAGPAAGPTWWTGLVIAGLWVGFEGLREVFPFGGFTWGNPAFSQPDTPLTGWAPIGGVAAVTFVIIVVAYALSLFAEVGLERLGRRSRPRTATRDAQSTPVGADDAAERPTKTVATTDTSVHHAMAWGIAAVLSIGVGLAVPRPTDGQTQGGPAEATVAVIQGNVPRLGLDFNAQREAVLTNHIIETSKLASGNPGEESGVQAVIWPENSSDVDPLADRGVSDRISAAVDAVGVPVLIGAVVREESDPAAPRSGPKLLNIGIVWEPRTATSPGGPSDAYVKQHLVPFGEYVPFRPILTRLIGRYSRVPLDFRPGTDSGVLQLGPARVADVICFEIAYTSLVRTAVLDGGRAIVVQTNNATYGKTSQPQQQLAMSQFRAAEHGRTVLVAATSGISAVIAPDGTLEQRTDEFVPARLVATAPLRDSLTLADMLGLWPTLLAGLVGLAGLAVALARRSHALRRRGANGSAASGSAG